MDISIEIKEPIKAEPIDFSVIPSIKKVSQLENDMGYITKDDIPKIDTSELATKEELNQKQDTIADLDAIRVGASLGVTAAQPEDITVTDVQVNGTSILNDGVANIPYASTSNWGVVKVVSNYGINTNSNGQLHIINPSDAQITGKSGFIAITCSTMDKALKNSITTNSIELTDDEKTSACNWLGAGHQRTTVIDSTTPTIVLDKALANTDYQYGIITSLSITEVENSYLETNIFFTAGAEITVDLPDTLKIIGNLSFEAEKQYVMSICNNTLIVGVVS